jgi:transposase
MQNAAAPTARELQLQTIVDEQQRHINRLQEMLRLSLHRQFGPRNDYVDVDQLSLLAAAGMDASVVIEQQVEESEKPACADGKDTPKDKVPRKKAIEILKELPRDIRIIDIPEDQKVCPCCGEPMQAFGHDSSEQLAYNPATIKIVETRKLKYSCEDCHSSVVRAKDDSTPPLAKSMASASLLAFLMVSKFCDHLPLYRISLRLQRLGIDMAHSLMSDWLLQCAELLEPLQARLMAKVLATGHIFTDDTILPMQNDEPGRNTTIKARLWVYACHHRRQKPLVAYDFSRSRSQEAPFRVLAQYRGFIQADAYPGYDRIYLGALGQAGVITEIACWAHARRKFKEVAVFVPAPSRAHDAIRFIKRLYHIETIGRNMSDADRQALRQEKAVPVLQEFKAWLDVQANLVLPKSALGNAVMYTLKNWDALCRYTEHGFLEADNNYAERCMKPVAIGRKNYMFVGNERGGRAAAIFYSLMESCKANKVNPLTYMTYILSNVRNKDIELLLPDEFDASSLTQIG